MAFMPTAPRNARHRHWSSHLIKMLFILPIGLCLVWFLYLQYFGYSMKQGKKGFVYILVFSAVVAGFYTSLLWLTH